MNIDITLITYVRAIAACEQMAKQVGASNKHIAADYNHAANELRDALRSSNEFNNAPLSSLLVAQAG